MTSLNHYHMVVGNLHNIVIHFSCISPGLESSIMVSRTESDTSKHLSLSSVSDLSDPWTDHARLVKLTCPSRHACTSRPFSLDSITSAKPAVGCKTRQGRMKSIEIPGAHPYLPRTSAPRPALGHHSGHLSLKPPKSVHSSCHRPMRNQISGCSKPTEPGNMFLEGFQDCASEVLRFLREVEHVEDTNPLVQGLQSHLAKVGRTIWPEIIADLEGSETRVSQTSPGVSEASQRQTRGCEDDQQTARNVLEPQPDTGLSVCPSSPIHTTSRADTSRVSFSESSSGIDSDVSLLSPSGWSDHSDSPRHQVSPASSGCGIAHSAPDLLSRTPSTSLTTRTCTETTSPSPSRPLSSLSSLSGAAINMAIACHQASLESVIHQPGRNSPSTNSSLLLSNVSPPSLNRSPPTLHSFPVDPLPPAHTQRTSPEESPLHLQTLTIAPQTQSTSTPPYTAGSALGEESGKSTPSTMDIPNTPRENLITGRYLGWTDLDIPQDTDPAITWCQQPPLLSASSLSLLYSQPVPLSKTDHAAVPACTSDYHTAALPACTSDLLPQVSSMLELRPNFLPGVDSSSVASGDFADVLLAVESCSGHENPRVRALAEELIHLIHNEGDDGDSEDEDEGDEGGELSDGEDGDGDGDRGDESGIEMDETWGNPADLIEQ